MDSSLHSLVASQMSTPITSSAIAQAQTSTTNHQPPTRYTNICKILPILRQFHAMKQISCIFEAAPYMTMLTDGP